MATFFSPAIIFYLQLPAGARALVFFTYWMIDAWLIAIALFGNWRQE